MQNPAFTVLSAVDLSLLVVWILAGRHWGNLGSWGFAAIQTAFKVHIHHLLRAITLQQTNYKPYDYKWLQTNGLTLCFDRQHHQLFSASLFTKHTTYILRDCCNSMACAAFSSVLLWRLLQPHLHSPSCHTSLSTSSVSLMVPSCTTSLLKPAYTVPRPSTHTLSTYTRPSSFQLGLPLTTSPCLCPGEPNSFPSLTFVGQRLRDVPQFWCHPAHGLNLSADPTILHLSMTFHLPAPLWFFCP